MGELENDVLLLDDLIGRQRLEDLASLGKELTDAHQRLQICSSATRRPRTPVCGGSSNGRPAICVPGSPSWRRRIAEVKSRNDVPEEWRNLPDTKQLAEEARKLDDMLQKGDDADLEKALAQLGDELRSMRKMLDQNAEGFGAERFPQENRVVADLMKRIGDLEGDERTLQKETQGIADRQQAEMEKRLRGELDQMLKREAEKAERLKQRLGGLQTGNPEVASARRSIGPERAPSRSAGCWPSGISPRRKAKRSGPRPASTGPARTSPSCRRPGAIIGRPEKPIATRRARR